MIETFDSVLDRIGAFNAATEKLAKRRASEITVTVAGRPEVRLRLAKTEDNYGIEVSGAPAEAAEVLKGMRFAPRGDIYAREVRKSERSWNVASQIEDLLQDVLGLGSNVAVTIETTG
ncbi:MAG: hypothetical protein ACHQ7M_05940 [Chloroflexota bacterium]